MMNFEHCTLFTTALCNLNCHYCYICKDVAGGLKVIDKDLEEDFKNGTQIKQILDYDENISQNLKGITLWGGEPFLHLERFVDNIDDYFKAFPNVKRLDTSTNFTIPNQAKMIEHLLNEIDRLYHGEEKFFFDLQISIDGYPEMNDIGRGKGVTQKFLDNFYDLLNIRYNNKKIEMAVHTKPTLAIDTFKYINTEEGILKWFEFFHQAMSEPHIQSNALWVFGPALWNCAQPTEWTAEDGKEYAKISRLIQKLTPEIFEKYPSWQCYDTLVPEAQLASNALGINGVYSAEALGHQFSVPTCGGGCGAFTGNIVPIPKGYYTMCHRGIFDEYTEYSNNLQSRDNMNNLSKMFFQAANAKDWILTKEQLQTLNHAMTPLYTCASKIRYTDLVVSIREYAIAGIIDEKYKNVKEIEKTLGYFLLNSYCLQDSYIFNGSWTTIVTLEVPLFYNGTMEVVAEELDRVVREKGWKL